MYSAAELAGTGQSDTRLLSINFADVVDAPGVAQGSSSSSFASNGLEGSVDGHNAAAHDTSNAGTGASVSRLVQGVRFTLMIKDVDLPASFWVPKQMAASTETVRDMNRRITTFCIKVKVCKYV